MKTYNAGTVFTRCSCTCFVCYSTHCISYSKAVSLICLQSVCISIYMGGKHLCMPINVRHKEECSGLFLGACVHQLRFTRRIAAWSDRCMKLILRTRMRYSCRQVGTSQLNDNGGILSCMWVMDKWRHSLSMMSTSCVFSFLATHYFYLGMFLF